MRNRIFMLLLLFIMGASSPVLAAKRDLTPDEKTKVIQLVKEKLALPTKTSFILGQMVDNPYNAYCGAVTTSSQRASIPFIVSLPEPVRGIDLRRVVLTGDNQYARDSVISQCHEYEYTLP